MLELDELRRANKERLKVFKNRLGGLAHPNGDTTNWSIPEWTNAMAGETGEACNVAKKLRRGDYGDEVSKGIDDLVGEIADAVIYADLACQRVGRRLEDAVRESFNKKSRQVGCDIRI